MTCIAAYSKEHSYVYHKSCS